MPAAAFAANAHFQDPLRSEYILDLALTDWLPALSGARDSRTEQEALGILAKAMVAEHGDSTLETMLTSSADHHFGDAVRLLSQAIREDSAGRRQIGYKRARQAVDLFHAMGNAAGELRAAEEAVYSLSRDFKTEACLEESGSLLKAARAELYPWIRIQILLARATCLGRLGDVGAGLALKQEAQHLAQSSHYPILQLRAIGLIATSATLVGNVASAREDDYAGLRNFWTGVFPPLRAYQFYSDLGDVADKTGHRQAAYHFAKEALPMIQMAGNKTTEAMAHGRIAIYAALTGRQRESEDELGVADGLLAQTQSTPSFRAETLILLAGTYLESGAPALASEALSKISEADVNPFISLKLTFHRLRGTIAVKQNRPTEASDEFHKAYVIAESALASVRSARDRANWQRDAGGVYRQLVRLWLDANKPPAETLALWEHYRSSTISMDGQSADGASAISGFAKGLHGSSVLSFVQFDDELAGWFFDDRGIHAFRSSLSSQEAARACPDFLKLTSRPDSDPKELRATAQHLYSKLIAPVEGWLDDRRLLALEGDGPCSGIAFEALIDPAGAYLADRFSVTTSPGAFAASRWTPARTEIGADLQAVVVADPTLAGELARIYPALPDAREEANAVARSFHKSTVLKGDEATLSAVTRSLAHAGVFHFAGHGVTTSDTGTLLLSAAGADSGAALLDASQVEGKLPQCRLAVLSACFSAAGERLGPFNPDSLVQAFWRAGVPTVVATRWAVDSGVASTLMSRFYNHMLQGEPPALALHASTLELRTNQSLHHPAYWAGFHVFGSPQINLSGAKQ